MKQPTKKPTIQQVADQKAVILAYLADGEKHSLREIQEATRINADVIGRRILSMRNQVEYLGRSGNNQDSTSWYRIIPQPGVVPATLRDYPSMYLRFGGWTV
jgi:hypothetical protein